jgi:hypothetical protein
MILEAFIDVFVFALCGTLGERAVRRQEKMSRMPVRMPIEMLMQRFNRSWTQSAFKDTFRLSNLKFFSKIAPASIRRVLHFTMPKHSLALSTSAIAPMVHLVRHEKVILDFDLAILYGVETGALKRAVRRNRERFPDDFMFQLVEQEAAALRCQTGISKASPSDNSSQSVILKSGRGGRRYLPYAFTEQGVAMLSSVLRSARAVQVNIAIMRTFVQLRRLMDSNRELARRIDSLERKYDEEFRAVFDAIKRLIAEDEARKAGPKREIGFHAIHHS